MARQIQIALILLILLLPLRTFAAVAEATIDWGSLTVATTPGLTLAFGDAFGGAFGPAINDFFDLQANLSVSGPLVGDMSVGSLVSLPDGTATSTAVSDPSDFPDSVAGPTGLITAIADATGPTAGPIDLIRTSNFRVLDITASGAGTATFTLDYTLGTMFETGSTPISRARSSVALGLLTASPTLTAFTNGGVGDTLITFPTGAPSIEGTAGTLVFAVDLFDTEMISLGVESSVELRHLTFIPIPAPIVLLSGACLTLLSLRKRAR